MIKEQILWTASITPFEAGGMKADLKSLEVCLRAQERAQNGVILFGSTGEGLSLSFEERKEILRFAFSLNLKLPIMVGVPSHNIKEALMWISWCQELPVAAYLLTTPIYTKPGILGQTAWFEALLEKLESPAMLYNIPSRSGVRLHPQTLKNLHQHKNLWALKDTESLESAAEYKMAAPNIALFAGDDYKMPAMATLGAVGLISIASNAWPEATRRYVEHCLRRGCFTSNWWWKAGLALFTASNPIPVKALMKDVGIIAHKDVRLPLSAEDLSSPNLLLDLHEKMKNWSADHELC